MAVSQRPPDNDFQLGDFAQTWRALAMQIRNVVRSISGRAQVVNVDASSLVTVTSYDETDPTNRTLAKLRDAFVEPGDDVLLLRADGSTYVLGTLGTQGKSQRARSVLSVLGQGNEDTRVSGVSEINFAGSGFDVAFAAPGSVAITDIMALNRPTLFGFGFRQQFISNATAGSLLGAPIPTVSGLSTLRAHRVTLLCSCAVTSAAGQQGSMLAQIPGTGWSKTPENPGTNGAYVDWTLGATSGETRWFGHSRDIAPGVSSITGRVVFKTSSTTNIQFDNLQTILMVQPLGA